MGSEQVALGHPVVPVRDAFVGCFVTLDGLQLRQGDRHGPALPLDEHQHVAGARFFGSHALDFDSFSFEEGRNALATIHLAWNGNRILPSR